MSTHKILFYLKTFLCVGLLTSCSYNPFSFNNHLTGSADATVVGGVAGGGAMALLGASKTGIGLGVLTGASLGYYISTLRFAAAPIMNAGGNVYSIGQTVGIVIPTDRLFDSNSTDFLPDAHVLLDSVVNILDRFPNNHVLISGNTSGFGSRGYQMKMSQVRARQVANYLWAHGVNSLTTDVTCSCRNLRYVGYGNSFPISHQYNACSLRKNSRIQITSYPSDRDLQIDARSRAMNNVGRVDDACIDAPVRDVSSCTSDTCHISGLP